MPLMKTQPKRGTMSAPSSNPTAKGGRAAPKDTQSKTGYPSKTDSNDTAKAGRASGMGSVHPEKGIGPGNADRGAGSASRLPDGVDGPFPSA